LAAFSIGSLGRDKSDLFKGKGSVNCLLNRDHRRLFAMRLTRPDCAADESGPSPNMSTGAFDDPVLDSSIFHVGRPCEVRDLRRNSKKLAKLSAAKKTAPDPLKDRDRQVWEDAGAFPAQSQPASMKAVPTGSRAPGSVLADRGR
jgi:hypothetical protein